MSVWRSLDPDALVATNNLLGSLVTLHQATSKLYFSGGPTLARSFYIFPFSLSAVPSSSSKHYAAMCFFERIQFKCGSWKWGKFRERCNKENRIGETCGLKLVFSIHNETGVCGACTKIAKKRRRIRKMTGDIKRWREQGNRPATVEKTESEVAALQCAISNLWEQHLEGQFGGVQQRHKIDRNNRQR